MKLTTQSAVPVYTIAGEGTARALPEWLARKRKRSLKKDGEYANRIELLQDFEFDEASQCVRVSEDGEWVVSTGTYKPQIHAHYLPHLSLSFARHTNTVNQTFLLLSSDYTKSLHLQTDRSLEFHTPGGLHYRTRIPRYGRDLKYNRRTAEALVPAVGVNADGKGEVFRLNLDAGSFMKSYEVDVGGDDFDSLGGGALQGGIRAGAVTCAAVAEESHGLMGFGTSLGTVEFWDARSRSRASVLGPPRSALDSEYDMRPEISALDFHRSGLHLASGTSTGLVYVYDLRSPVPLLRKSQGYDAPIHTLKYLLASQQSVSSDKILSADRRGIKLFDASDGTLWTSIEPAVDLNGVEWVPDSGMFLTANEGRQQHAFFVPQLGPAPKWCSFLDNLVEELAEDREDPHAFNSGVSGGEIYDNYKFVDMKQLAELSLDHLVESTNLLRPYMHGYFVPQKLYEQARLLTNPDILNEQRQKSIQEKIDRERESRIRGSKKSNVKVNRKLAEKLAAREEANERRKAQRLLRKTERGGESARDLANVQQESGAAEVEDARQPVSKKATTDLMADDRFKKLFEDDEFQIDETSREFQLHNPSSAVPAPERPRPRGLTAVEEENGAAGTDKSSDETDDDDAEDEEAEAAALRARQKKSDAHLSGHERSGRIGNASYKKSGHVSQRPREKELRGPAMQVSSSHSQRSRHQSQKQSRSFGDRANSMPAKTHRFANADQRGAVGEKAITFAPTKQQGRTRHSNPEEGRERSRAKVNARRSASGNVMRGL